MGGIVVGALVGLLFIGGGIYMVTKSAKNGTPKEVQVQSPARSSSAPARQQGAWASKSKSLLTRLCHGSTLLHVFFLALLLGSRGRGRGESSAPTDQVSCVRPA